MAIENSFSREAGLATFESGGSSVKACGADVPSAPDSGLVPKMRCHINTAEHAQNLERKLWNTEDQGQDHAVPPPVKRQHSFTPPLNRRSPRKLRHVVPGLHAQPLRCLLALTVQL
jgi:hypothetical protein